MGILSLCFVAILAFHIPFIGRGNYVPIPGNGGPCQPFKNNQTRTCAELQAFVQLENGAGKFCNDFRASCRSKASRGRRIVTRKDPYRWKNCYCDEKCEEIGDCCVDYDFRHTPRTRTTPASRTFTCRRAPSDHSVFSFGFMMVARCPPYWNDAKTAHACTSTTYSADPLTALPVVDMTSNITYANSYCAMCHGKSQNLHPWTIQIYSLRMRQHEPSLQDMKTPGTVWEAVPFDKAMPDRCIVTPSEAYAEPDTKIKQQCRSYANGIEISLSLAPHKKLPFKSPHCAIVEGYNLSAAARIKCSSGWGRLVPPLMLITRFTFSIHAKQVQTKWTKTVHVKFNCSINELYDPFKEQCFRVQAVPLLARNNELNSTKRSFCLGPSFPSNEFRVFSNNSVLLLPHQKIYPNGSYILVNRTLVLCSNFTRNYTKQTEKPVTEEPVAEKKTTSSQPRTAVHIITYVGFSLSIIFLLFLLVTYFLFAELRTYPGKRVMHLSCATIAMQSVYFASDPDVVSSAVCAVIGALLHFFILASFVWMSAIAHDTHKIFSTPDVNPSTPVVIAKRRKTYIRDSLFCWVSPLVLVGICVALQLTNTGNVVYGNKDDCQLSFPARTYADACPVSLMLVFNIIAVIRTAIVIKTQGNVTATNQRSLLMIVAKLTAVMGITWILGFLLAFYPTPYIEYPFIIVNSCQGILISLSFVFKKNVFALYKQKFTKKTHPELETTATVEQKARLPGENQA